MMEEVEFWKVEICSNAKINKDTFVVMKASQGFSEKHKSLIGVARVLSEVKEVEDGTSSMNKATTVKISRQSDINDDTEQKAADLVMFHSTDMRKATDAFHKQAV